MRTLSVCKIIAHVLAGIFGEGEEFLNDFGIELLNVIRFAGVVGEIV